MYKNRISIEMVRFPKWFLPLSLHLRQFYPDFSTNSRGILRICENAMQNFIPLLFSRNWVELNVARKAFCHAPSLTETVGHVVWRKLRCHSWNKLLNCGLEDLSLRSAAEIEWLHPTGRIENLMHLRDIAAENYRIVLPLFGFYLPFSFDRRPSVLKAPTKSHP